MPVPRPPFMSGAEVKAKIELAGRKVSSNVRMNEFGHVKLPGGAYRYPRPYIEALLNETTGPIGSRTLRAFNKTDIAKRAFQAANADFLHRLEAFVVSGREPRVLTPDGIATLLSVSRTGVNDWIYAKVLPVSREANGRLFVLVTDLRRLCQWVLPKD